MKTVSILASACFPLVIAGMAAAHDANGEPHPQLDAAARPPEILLAQNVPQNRATVGQRNVRTNRHAFVPV